MTATLAAYRRRRYGTDNTRTAIVADRPSPRAIARRMRGFVPECRFCALAAVNPCAVHETDSQFLARTSR